jgi:hypothetical protein
MQRYLNVKIFLTFAAAIYLLYGICYFFFPQRVADVYGFTALVTPISTMFLQFLGIFCIASAILFGIARKAEISPGRTAALAFLAVLALLSLYMDVRTLMNAPGAMDYADTLLNGFFGCAALYFILKDRCS